MKALRLIDKKGSFQLRCGAKGTGKVLASVRYWENSEKSITEAEIMIMEAATKYEGYSIFTPMNSFKIINGKLEIIN